jgi:pyrroline-5-carboxylate reductase
MPDHRKWLFIGGGNMARAMIQGSLRQGQAKHDSIAAVEPAQPAQAALRSIGIQRFEEPHSALEWLADVAAHAGPGIIVLAVKPQSLAEVGAAWAVPLSQDPCRMQASRTLNTQLVLSILAGTPSEKVRSALGAGEGTWSGSAGGSIGVIRAMPNLPASVGQGVTAVALGAGAKLGDEAPIIEFFRGIGPLVERIDESMMDAFTAVAGSGPAYVMLLAEAMIQAGVSLGFDPAQARRIAVQTLLGSATLLSGGDHEPEAIRASVTSKGGTTAAAIAVLEAAEVKAAVVRAIQAARDRGRELARGA